MASREVPQQKLLKSCEVRSIVSSSNTLLNVSELSLTFASKINRFARSTGLPWLPSKINNAGAVRNDSNTSRLTARTDQRDSRQFPIGLKSRWLNVRGSWSRFLPTAVPHQSFRYRVSVLRIAEIYQSIQGEGEFTGTSSIFVRTTGCNLRCWFCDTPFTSWEPEGQPQSVDQVLKRVSELDVQHVVVTGGEPLLLPDVVPLTAELRQRGYFVTIETAGTVFREATADLMSISPKLANSTPSAERSLVWSKRHEKIRHRPTVIRSLIADSPYQFKFVIDQSEDIDQVEDWLSEFPEIDRSRVWLMPQATTREELATKTGWIQSASDANGFQFTSRLHIEQFGNARGH